MDRASLVRRVWDGWRRVGKKIGNFQARVLLTFFYFFIIGPFALLIRWRSDPLGINAGSAKGWIPRSDREGTPMKRAAEQF